MTYTWKDWLAMGVAVAFILAVLTALGWVASGCPT